MVFAGNEAESDTVETPFLEPQRKQNSRAKNNSAQVRQSKENDFWCGFLGDLRNRGMENPLYRFLASPGLKAALKQHLWRAVYRPRLPYIPNIAHRINELKHSLKLWL